MRFCLCLTSAKMLERKEETDGSLVENNTGENLQIFFNPPHWLKTL